MKNVKPQHEQNEPISVTQVPSKAKIELRIHGAGPQGDQPILLAAREARLVAYKLLVESERLIST